MKQKVAFLAATTLLAGGCSAGTERSAVPEWHDAPAATVEQPAPSEQPLPGKIVIKVGAAATKHVPKQVAHEVNTAAAVTIVVGPRVAEPEEYIASAVAIKGGFLSSGHLLRTKKGNPQTSCRDAKVITPQTTAAGRYDLPFTQGKTIQTEHSDTISDPKQIDLALLRTKTTPSNTATLSAKNQDMKPGTRLTIVNYQPTPSKNLRAPDLSGEHSEPAILDGYVLSDPQGDSEQIAVMTGVDESYGAIYDDTVRGGASGGPAFTPDGIARALLTASGDPRTDSYTVPELEDEFGVDIEGVHTPDEKVQLTWMQPINDHLVRSLGTSPLAATVHCATS